jgi:hypothetical protein
MAASHARPAVRTRGHIPALPLAFSLAALLASCVPAGQDASLYYAGGEVGKSFGIQPPRRVYACPRPIPKSVEGCIVRANGYFTVDSAAQQPSDHRTILHLVFEDGKSGWMSYDDFLRQRPVPARLGRVARLGMTTEEIKSSWGAPAAIAPEPSPGGGTREKWSYPGIGELFFEDGKLVELGLKRALPLAR